MISTKIFHAIGYHVPEDFVVRVAPHRLEAAPHAKMRTENGKRRLIRQEDVAHWLRDQPRGADGSVRALPNRYVPGKVLGPYQDVGTRPDVLARSEPTLP